MVSIYMDMEKHQLKIDGHANADEFGKDLVCCAVSILVQTLSRYIEARKTTGDLISAVNVIESGKAEITAEPRAWFEREITAAFATVRLGLRALAEDYPENIKMEEV